MVTELQFECAGLKDGERIPLRYTGRGEDVSPEFVIHNLAPNAKTIAIIAVQLKNLPKHVDNRVWHIAKI